jgi:hypothetical protein
MYTVEMASCGVIFLPSFIKIGTAVQAILRFCFKYFTGCDVDITDARDL